MSLLVTIITILILDVALLVRAELRDNRKQIYIYKPIATLLVIAVAAQSFGNPGVTIIYSIMVLTGLGLSLGGDLALMFPNNQKAFRLGLVCFLLAHLVYSGAFFKFGSMTKADILPILLLLVVSSSFFLIIRPGLGTMRSPVIAYIAIISLMVAGAWVVEGTAGIHLHTGYLILFGANLFYISDLILASNRFWKPWKYNRISLMFYYGGQLSIALSANTF